MPTRDEPFSTIAIMKILTLRLTNSIGNYENHYLQAMDSNGRAFVQKYIYISKFDDVPYIYKVINIWESYF